MPAMWENRFWDKVAKTENCWLWTGALLHGYGSFCLNGKYKKVHRISYELLIGPIPDGLQLDHLCRVRHCVNPAHLEPVTIKENTLRGQNFIAKHAKKTSCIAGHPFDSENTIIRVRGKVRTRVCRKCGQKRKKEWKERQLNAA